MSETTKLQAAAQAEETKVIGFFEKNPKAIAIGSAIAAVFVVFLIQHIF